MTNDLSGRTAVITGAGALPGRGMGRMICQAIGALGANIIAADIDFESATRTAEILQNEGVNAVAVHADVTDGDAVRKMYDTAIAEFGRLDILVNHAGFGSYNSITETDDELWYRMINLNLTAPFLATRQVLPHMLERGSGVIINTISSAGLAGGRAGAAYTAAKHGLVGLTKNTAFVYGGRGIRAVGIAPGYTRSGDAPQISTSDSETKPLLDPVADLSVRNGKPEEVAAAFAFLASDAASYVNGVILPVDGGWTSF